MTQLKHTSRISSSYYDAKPYGGDDASVEICHRLARDRTGTKRLGTDLYREFLQLPLTDEPTFIRGIRDLLLRAWTERCRAV